MSMRGRLGVGALIVAIFFSTGCEHSTPVTEKTDLPVVSVATPPPAPEKLAAITQEKPPAPPKQTGLAEVSEKPPVPVDRLVPSDKPKNEATSPRLDLGANYPKAPKKPQRVKRYHPPVYTVSYLPPPRMMPPVVGPPRPNYPVSRPPTPQSPARYPANLPPRPQGYCPPSRPPVPSPPSAYRPPRQTLPASSTQTRYPPYGLSKVRSYEERHRALEQQYLQARANALNIKYNRGRRVFTANSPQVMMSSLAPPLNRPMSRAPWDTLGQAFDHSEQIRGQLRALERNRYSGAALPSAPPGPPGPPGPPSPYER